MSRRAIFSIRSSSPEKTKEFYLELGIPLRPVVINTFKYDFFVFGNAFLLLSGRQCSVSDTNLCLYDDNKLLNTVNDKGVVFGSEYSCLDSDIADELLGLSGREIAQLSTTSLSIIPVLRVAAPLFIVRQLNAIGRWVKEKHGSAGQEHYCLAVDGLVVEIYPVRKRVLSESQWELVITNSLTCLNLNNKDVISKSESSILIRDINGSVINLYHGL